MDSNIMLLAGMSLMIFLLMRNLSRRSSGKSIGRQLKESANHFKTKEPRKDGRLLDAPAQVGRWQVEMHETARDLKAELDSKILILQSVIKTARQEIDRLETVIKSSRTI